MSNSISWSPDDHQAITLSLDTLAHYGLPIGNALARYKELRETAERQPDADDLKWPLIAPESIGEHLSLGNDRVTLDNHLVKGRMYSLTPGQREIMREWYGLTPTQLVEVIDIQVYIGTQCIRSVKLASTGLEYNAGQAIKGGRNGVKMDTKRHHVLNRITIDRWGKFMSESKANDDARVAARELADSERPVMATKAGSTTESPRKTLVELMGEYGV